MTVSCHCDMAEKMMQAALNTIPLINVNFLPRLNSLPNNIILDLTKLKAFVDNKLNVAKMTISLFDRVENTVQKGENTDYQHFLLFPQCFPKSSSSWWF